MAERARLTEIDLRREEAAAAERCRVFGQLVAVTGAITDAIGTAGRTHATRQLGLFHLIRQGEPLLEAQRAASRALEQLRYSVPELHAEAIAVFDALDEVRVTVLRRKPTELDLHEKVRRLSLARDALVKGSRDATAGTRLRWTRSWGHCVRIRTSGLGDCWR